MNSRLRPPLATGERNGAGAQRGESEDGSGVEFALALADMKMFNAELSLGFKMLGFMFGIGRGDADGRSEQGRDAASADSTPTLSRAASTAAGWSDGRRS
jgi:hypothetical protein